MKAEYRNSIHSKKLIKSSFIQLLKEKQKKLPLQILPKGLILVEEPSTHITKTSSI